MKGHDEKTEIEKLFDFENENKDELLKYRVDGELLYPFIRFYLSVGSQSEINSLVKRNKKRILRYIFDSLSKNPFLIKNKEIVSFGGARNEIEKEGKYFNTINDYFNFLKPEETAFIEQSYELGYKNPRAFRNSYYLDMIRWIYFFRYALSKNFKASNEKEFGGFIELILNKHPNRKNISRERLMERLIIIKSQIKTEKKVYSFIFRRVRPKVIFLLCASYGADSHTIKLAREMGIKTAEFQHGLISKGHFAYNNSEKLLGEKEYSECFPDYFLVYGEYWMSQCNMPSKKIIVGNPHFYESMKNHRGIKEDKNTILIASQSSLTEFFVEIAEYLAVNMKDYKIIFKLHPLEMKKYHLIKPLERYKNIAIHETGDIYGFIARSGTVVAGGSTTIFEAIGFNKNVFVLDNDFCNSQIPKEIGMRFKTKEQLMALIISSKNKKPKARIEDFFHKEWKENYMRFLKKEIKA